MAFFDTFDLKILSLLQRDATMQLDAIAAAVGLSPSPCWRRIKRMEEEGVITGRVALVDRKAVNVNVTVFAAIRTNEHSPGWLAEFSRIVSDIPEVVEFYRMAGQVDYLLKIVVPSIEAYDDVYRRLISKVTIHDVSSMFAMEEIKGTTAMPLDYVALK